MGSDVSHDRREGDEDQGNWGTAMMKWWDELGHKKDKDTIPPLSRKVNYAGSSWCSVDSYSNFKEDQEPNSGLTPWSSIGAIDKNPKHGREEMPKLSVQSPPITPAPQNEIVEQRAPDISEETKEERRGFSWICGVCCHVLWKWRSFLNLLVGFLPLVVIGISGIFGGILSLVENDYADGAEDDDGAVLKWDWYNGFLYVVTNLCGLGNPLTNVVPQSTVGKSLDLFLSYVALALGGFFIGVFGSLEIVSKTTADYENLFYWNEKIHHNIACVVFLFLVVPAFCLGISVLFGLALAGAENWRFVSGYQYVASNLSGLANPLTGDSPDTDHYLSTFISVFISAWALAIAGAVIGALGNLSTVAEFVTWVDSFSNLEAELFQKVQWEDKTTKGLRAVFRLIDRNGSESLEKDELVAALSNDDEVKLIVQILPSLEKVLLNNDLDDAFARMDKDGSGSVSWTEFHQFCKKEFQIREGYINSQPPPPQNKEMESVSTGGGALCKERAVV